MVAYFLKRQSQIHGPIDGVKLVHLARAGKVKRADEVSTSQEGPWQTADRIKALKAVFDQGKAVAAVNPPAKPAEMGQWFVNISGFAGDKIEGPVTSQRIKDLIDEKQVTAKTQVMHPVETGNEWVLLRKTELMQHIEQRKRERREKRRATKLEKKTASLEQDQASQGTGGRVFGMPEKRTLIITGTLVGVLLIGGLGAMFFFAGDDDTTAVVTEKTKQASSSSLPLRKRVETLWKLFENYLNEEIQKDSKGEGFPRYIVWIGYVFLGSIAFLFVGFLFMLVGGDVTDIWNTLSLGRRD